MRKLIAKALVNLTKRNILLIVIFSTVYSFLNPTLSVLAGLTTARNSDEIYNITTALSVVVLLTLTTVVIEFIYTKKTAGNEVAAKFLVANLVLLLLSITALFTASGAKGSSGNSQPQASEYIYYFAIFMHISLIKVLSLLFPVKKI